MTDSLGNLTVEAFAARVGQPFRIHAGQDTAIDAELIEARTLVDTRRAPAAAPKRRVPFSLSFRTALTAPLPQRIYDIEHADMGSYEIFLVPVGPDGTGMVYEAIFT